MLKTLKFLAAILVLGLCIPQHAVIPVLHASSKDWNSQSFWFAPWGKSGVHKGVDIFATKGTPTLAATSGLVVYVSNTKRGGNVVGVLSAKWRIHYYAHLESIQTQTLSWVDIGQAIGTVGNTGNAVGKPTHLHYSVISLIPYPWRITRETQGWKKMFFMNPLGEIKQPNETR